MAMSVKWHDDSQKVLMIEMSPPLEWPAFDAAVDEATRMANTVKHDIVLVMVPLEEERFSLPAGPALPHMRRLMHLLPTNIKYITDTAKNMNPLVRSLLDVLARIGYAKRMASIKTLEDAQKLLSR